MSQPLTSTNMSNDISDLKTCILNLRIEDHFRKFFSDIQEEIILNQEKFSKTPDTLETRISALGDKVDTQFDKLRKKLSTEIKESSSTLIKQTRLSVGSVNGVINKNVTDIKHHIKMLSEQIKALSDKINVVPKAKTPDELYWEENLGIHFGHLLQDHCARHKLKISNKLPVNLIRTSFISEVMARPVSMLPVDYPVITRKNGTSMVIVGAIDASVKLRMANQNEHVTTRRFFVVNNLEHDAYLTREISDQMWKTARAIP